MTRVGRDIDTMRRAWAELRIVQRRSRRVNATPPPRVTAGEVVDGKPYELADISRAIAQLPEAATCLIGDRGYDADGSRRMLREQGIESCIPARENRKASRAYDKGLYKERHRMENLSARLKDWRRVATRHDRRPELYLSAVVRACVVFLWLSY